MLNIWPIRAPGQRTQNFSIQKMQQKMQHFSITKMTTTTKYVTTLTIDKERTTASPSTPQLSLKSSFNSEAQAILQN